MNLMDLFVKVAYDDSSVDKGIDGTSKKGSGFATKLGKAFKGVGAAVGAISTAAVALGTAFVKGAMDVSDYGSNVNDMSQKLNISKKGFQEWNYILGQSGTDIGVLQMGMKTLSNAAVDGNKSFKKLGISQKELQALSTEELFNKTIEQLSGMEAGNERTALAADLFGRSATELLPILNMGADGLEEMRKQAEDYGLVMSDDAVNASDAFGDSVSLMQQTLTGMKNRMISEFFPALTQVTDGLALLFTGDMSGLDSINSGISDFVDKIAEAIPQIVEVGGSILQTLATAIIDNMPLLVETAFNLISEFGMFVLENLPMLVETAFEILNSLGTGITEQLPTLFPVITEMMNSILVAIIENIPLLLDGAVQMLTGIADGMVENVPVIAERIPELITALVEGFTQNLTPLLEAGLQIIVAIASGLIQSIPTILNSIPEILMAVVQTFADLAPQVWEAGVNLVEGIWQGITNGTEWIFGKLGEWVGSIIDWIKGLFGIASPSKEMADGVGKYISEGVGEGITDNVKAVTDAAGKLSDAVVAESQTMSQAGIAVVNALGQGMLTRIVALGQQFKAWFVQYVILPIRSLYAQFYETGRYMSMGFIIGMLSRRQEIIDDARALAESANQAFQAGLREKSPSKATYEAGEYFVLGFTNAINSGVNDVQSAVGQMANAALGFSGNIEQGVTSGGSVRGAFTIGDINFNQPVTSPISTAKRIRTEMEGLLYGLA